jgi:hypothetical protein
MIIKLVSNNDDALTGTTGTLSHALILFLSASRDIMHDDIRHKPLLDAYNEAIIAFKAVGVDIVLVDEDIENDNEA